MKIVFDKNNWEDMSIKEQLEKIMKDNDLDNYADAIDMLLDIAETSKDVIF